MQYSKEVPTEYSRSFYKPYNSNEIINQENINDTEEIMDIQNKYIYNGEDNIVGKPTVRYNPLFSPSDLIDHAIHVERYKTKNGNKNGNGSYNVKTDNTDKPYDAYLNFLKTSGLANDSSELRYTLDYINIDSGNRKKEPYNIFDKYFELTSDRFRIEENKFKISLKDSSFYIGQKISIEGLQPLTVKHKYTNSNLFMKFTENSPYVEINTNGNLTFDVSKYTDIDTSKLLVELGNIEGNNLSSYIGNIPINLLNKKHRMYLINNTDISGNNKFFIKLPINSDGTQALTSFYLTIKFYHYNCIPINEINANYPIDNNHINGYQIINSITDTEIDFIIFPPVNNYTGNTYNTFPVNTISLNTISSISKGYPNSHSYAINLPKTYSNIVQVRMVSSVFPNVFRAFKGFPSAQQNNKLYFQDIDNGDNVQYVELEEGTYTDREFITRMEYKFSLLTREIDITDSSYESNYYVKINIERSRDYIEFKNYRRALLTKPIISIEPPINKNDATIGLGTYTISINHPNHKITNIGTEITLINFLSHLGINATDINKTHKISKIIDDNTYQIELSRINLDITKTETQGGYGCEILVPREMRLLFTYSDSMGEQIGFRNIGDANSITFYSTTITNKEPYENEITFDVLKNTKIFTNSSLTFYKDQYIIITCKELTIIKNTRQPINIFGKINLTNNTNELLIDSIVCPPIFYYNPLDALSTLTFEFFTPDGKQYDFNNIDHSFVLEFTMMDNIPENTGLLSDKSNAR